MRLKGMTHFAILSFSALAIAGCTKDPTEGKATAQVAEAKQEQAAPAAAETLKIDAGNSKVGFVGAKVTAEHVGEFQEFEGTVSLVDGKLEGGKVEFKVNVDKMVVDGGLEKLEGHLRSPDFFDVEKFPTASFSSTEVKAGSDREGFTHTVTGNLELRGTKRSVTFPAAVEVGPSSVKAKTEFGINRKDFGIEYPGMPDDLIKDNVLIRVDFNAPRGTAAN